MLNDDPVVIALRWLVAAPQTNEKPTHTLPTRNLRYATKLSLDDVRMHAPELKANPRIPKKQARRTCLRGTSNSILKLGGDAYPASTDSTVVTPHDDH